MNYFNMLLIELFTWAKQTEACRLYLAAFSYFNNFPAQGIKY